MKNNDKLKSERLNMPFSTANSQLRKLLLFKYVQIAGEDICYRCGERINSIEDFSIEHKNAWLPSLNPRETFFDLVNIAFSHRVCNSNAAVRPRIYSSKSEYFKVNRDKYYARHKDEINAKKRLRDRRNPEKHGPDKCFCEPGKSCGGRPRL